jgi:hypothetical protein
MSTGVMRMPRSGYVERSSSSGLAEVLDVLLDKGLVIDIFLRVSLVGIELLTVDARIVIASVDTYLRFAEAVNRLDIGDAGGEGLPELMENITSDGAQNKTKGMLEGAKEALFGSSDEDEDEDKDKDQDKEEEKGQKSSGSRRRSSGGRQRSQSSRGR